MDCLERSLSASSLLVSGGACLAPTAVWGRRKGEGLVMRADFWSGMTVVVVVVVSATAVVLA